MSARCKSIDTFKRAALVGKPTAPKISNTLRLLSDFLEECGIGVFLEKETARCLQLQDFTVLTAEEIGHQVDLAIVLGGDGTMLGIARQLAQFGTPLIGINHGRLGFMTDIALSEMVQAIGMIVQGEFETEYRSLLDVQIVRGNNVIFHGLALNDVVVARKARIGLIELEIMVNGDFMSRQRADGLIVSSPTGSTAYGLAAGGPILHPALTGFALTPISPQSLSNRSIIVPEDAHITVGLVRGEEATANFDMQTFTDVRVDDRIDIARSRHRVTFLHPKGWSYYGTLRSKLHWHEFPSADGQL